jgi:hypothetical protein
MDENAHNNMTIPQASPFITLIMHYTTEIWTVTHDVVMRCTAPTLYTSDANNVVK